MQCCNKHVIIYSGARVSEFIRAIRSFIGIDKRKKQKPNCQLENLMHLVCTASMLELKHFASLPKKFNPL